MRICPHCEYVDPLYWKHVKYSYYIDSCSFENFKLLKPELAKRLALKHGSTIEDKHYVYRITKDGYWIERKAKIDFIDIKNKNWRDGTEKSPYKSPYYRDQSRVLWRNFSEGQKRLLEDK